MHELELIVTKIAETGVIGQFTMNQGMPVTTKHWGNKGKIFSLEESLLGEHTSLGTIISAHSYKALLPTSVVLLLLLLLLQCLESHTWLWCSLEIAHLL